MGYYSMKFWGENLFVLDEALALKVAAQTGDPLKGHVSISLRKLDEETKNALLAAAPLLAKMTAPGSLEEYEMMNKAILHNATKQAKTESDKQAAIKRLETYHDVRRLLPSDHNVRLITAELDRTEWSAAGVDRAVAALSGQLEYGAAPPPPAAPQPVILSDGSEALPDGTVPAKYHTLAQLRDLSKRRGEGKSRPNAFGSKFF